MAITSDDYVIYSYKIISHVGMLLITNVNVNEYKMFNNYSGGMLKKLPELPE